MCGQAGVYSRNALSASEMDRVWKLLVLNRFRGSDSTGIMWGFPEKPEKGSQFYFNKTKQHPFQFAEIEWPKMEKNDWSKPVPNLIAVHCRAATIGKVTEENSHPFHVKHILGMHNGTISADFEGKSKFETDSEALYNLIATEGVEKAIKSLPVYNTAYALVWLDLEKQTLNFLRNSARPLSFHNVGRTLYWSSEEKDVKYVIPDMYYNSQKNEKEEDREDVCMSFKQDTLYTLDLKSSERIRFTLKEIKPETKIYSSTSNWRGGKDSDFFPKNTQSTYSKYNEHRTPEYLHAIQSVSWNLVSANQDTWKESVSFTGTGNEAYVFELDGYCSVATFAARCLWRYANKNLFVEEVRNRILSIKSKTQLKNDLAKAGWSKNLLKKILSNRVDEFLTDQFRYSISLNKKFYMEFTQIQLHRAKGLAGNVIPFAPDTELPDILKDDEEDKEGDNNLPFGQSGSLPDLKSELEKTLQKGCCWCDDPQDIADVDVMFFLTADSFLCPSCQDKCCTGEIDSRGFPNGDKIWEFVANREVA